jgi:hypothetical protein
MKPLNLKTGTWVQVVGSKDKALAEQKKDTATSLRKGRMRPGFHTRSP